MKPKYGLLAVCFFGILCGFPAVAENPPAPAVPSVAGQAEGYLLGPLDMVFIRVQDVDDLGPTSEAFRVDLSGYVDVPRIGRVQAAGLTVDQLEAELTQRFRKYLQEPVVTVKIAEFHSQRVSVLGAVGQPGVHTLQGSRTLVEVISDAGGLNKDAGTTIEITRRKDEGPIPIGGARPDVTGQFTVARINIRDILDAKAPQDNILVRPDDVITVPQAQLVYVIGAVKQAGGFTLSEQKNLSVLQALAMANGLDGTASPSHAKILRMVPGSTNRTEVAVNVKKILAGKASDVSLESNDILFIPTSTAKNASLKVIQAMMTAGTGIAVYGPRY